LKKQTHSFLVVEPVEVELDGDKNEVLIPIYEGKVEILPMKGGK
jgi:hypothetical protein